MVDHPADMLLRVKDEPVDELMLPPQSTSRASQAGRVPLFAPEDEVDSFDTTVQQQAPIEEDEKPRQLTEADFEGQKPELKVSYTGYSIFGYTLVVMFVAPSISHSTGRLTDRFFAASSRTQLSTRPHSLFDPRSVRSKCVNSPPPSSQRVLEVASPPPPLRQRLSPLRKPRNSRCFEVQPRRWRGRNGIDPSRKERETRKRVIWD